LDLKIELVGLKGVEDALSQAGPKLAKRAMRQALKAGAESYIEAVKRNTPVLAEETPQRKPGELRDSIQILATRLSPSQESGRIRIGPAHDKSKGNQSPGVYGKFVEYGSVHNIAQPFMRSGYSEATPKALEEFSDVLRTAVDTLNK
jgi:HK97 gp10 family phage protein